MQVLKYKIINESNHGTDDAPNIVQTLRGKKIYSSDEKLEANLAIAKAEAYNGEVTVEKMHAPEPAAPSQAEELAELREQLKAQQAIINALLGEE